MVSAAVVNALQVTMSVGESLRWLSTLAGLEGFFSHIMVLKLHDLLQSLFSYTRCFCVVVCFNVSMKIFCMA